MGVTFYQRLHERLRDLAAQGRKVSDPEAGTRAARIHKWIRETEECLSLFEDQAFLSEFRVLQSQGPLSPPFQRIVNDDEEDSCSPSAYRVDKADVLFDFRFDLLTKVTDILRAAAMKLEIAGHSVPTLGEQLRDARDRAGHSQRAAAKKLGYDHKYISEWETGKRKPHAKQAKNIRDYILGYPETK
jgi:DNA-binding XRE family transcriptional regulator